MVEILVQVWRPENQDHQGEKFYVPAQNSQAELIQPSPAFFVLFRPSIELDEAHPHLQRGGVHLIYFRFTQSTNSNANLFQE